MKGYHVEFLSKKHHIDVTCPEKSTIIEIAEAKDISASNVQDTLPVREVDVTKSEHYPVFESATKPAEETLHFKQQIQSEPLELTEIQKESLKPAAQIHPAAAGSLLFGILSALCFIGLFISSFSPLALVIGLSVGLFAFAILAKVLSKRAFEDMHYARNRYSGRALAAAGLALGVITIVAYIGLLAVIVFGIAFTNLI